MPLKIMCIAHNIFVNFTNGATLVREVSIEI